MISQDDSPKTARFIDPWPWLALLSSGVLFVLIVVAPSFSRMLLVTRVTVEPEAIKPVVQPFTLEPQPFGAMRVDVKAEIPVDRWLTYEIQVQDSQGQILAAVIKNAWHEQGIWREEGQTGTWQEKDVRSGLDVQAQQSEEVLVSVAVLEYSMSAGGPYLEEPVSFVVTLRNGVVDLAYLWPGLIGTVLMSWIAFQATRFSGKAAIVRKIGDSDVRDRAILGGPDNLVRADVAIQSDRRTPRELTVKVWVRDGNGVPVYQQSHRVKTHSRTDGDGNVMHYAASLKLFFQFEAVDSYGFAVEVMPDGPVDSTTLKVWQQARTRLPVMVTPIAAPR